MPDMRESPEPSSEIVLRDVIAAIRDVVGEEGIITDPRMMESYLNSWRDNWRGRSPLIVRPLTTEQMSRVVQICVAAQTAIVPQGGNTGVTGAGQPRENRMEIVVSTNRMKRIRAIDVENDTMTVEAGCVLAVVREAAEAAGRLFPLNFGAAGSCQIGGNISTNAGGINVLRYGNTRNLVAGLEVVLPDGRIWNGLRGLRKDNAGYDLKQIFIGAEGTLGIITAAVLRLFPLPRASVTALLAMASPADALKWLVRVKHSCSSYLSVAELIERICIDVTCKHIPGVSDVLSSVYPWYLLVEFTGPEDHATLRAALEREFQAGFEKNELLNGVIASSEAQARILWRMRESIPEAHKQEGLSFKHDISVPVSKVPAFLDRAREALEREFPGIRMFSFGHLGDGNIHFNPLSASDRPANSKAADLASVNRIVHDLVVSFGGSISAEHGIGRLRREELRHYKSAVELEMMAALKRAFDPQNIMNPGKVIPDGLLA
jgi:FAD/FMN-containing dehydrogenase